MTEWERSLRFALRILGPDADSSEDVAWDSFDQIGDE